MAPSGTGPFLTIGGERVLLFFAGNRQRREPARADDGDLTWTENGAAIVALGQVVRTLGRTIRGPVRSRMPDGTPILLSPGACERDPFELEVALHRSGLRLRSREGTVWIENAAEALRSRSRSGSPTQAPADPPPASELTMGTDPQDRALANGAVVVGGEFLEPPYVVRMGSSSPPRVGADLGRVAGLRCDEDREVLVNLRRVFPPMCPTPDCVETVEAIHRAIGHPQHEDLVAAARTSGVASVTWRGEHDIVIRDARGLRLRCGLSGRPEERSSRVDALTSRVDDAPTPRVVLVAVARGIEDTLANGGLVLAGRDYFLTVTADHGASLRRRIETIRDSGEPEALRILRVQAHGIQRQAAVDIVRAASRASMH